MTTVRSPLVQEAIGIASAKKHRSQIEPNMPLSELEQLLVGVADAYVALERDNAALILDNKKLHEEVSQHKRSKIVSQRTQNALDAAKLVSQITLNKPFIRSLKNEKNGTTIDVDFNETIRALHAAVVGYGFVVSEDKPDPKVQAIVDLVKNGGKYEHRIDMGAADVLVDVTQLVKEVLKCQ